MLIFELLLQFLGVIVVIALCLWLGMVFRLWSMKRTKPNIKEGLKLPMPEQHLVSIVVPAHNEERVVDCCAKSLRGQSYENLQIIFVLDRCTDQTLNIIQRHALEDSRVIYIEKKDCPVDWSGKCHAAQVGANQAIGKWILFTDADTEFDKELVRCAIASATERGATLLSLLSSLTISKLFEKIIQPIASTFLVRQYPVDRINRVSRSRPFANGQFLLFLKEEYDNIGGHQAVKDELLEDIAFARLVHKHKLKVQVLFADGMLTCSMYDTFLSFKNGWTRIYIEASTRNVNRLRRSAVLTFIVTFLFPLFELGGICLGYYQSKLLFWLSISAVLGNLGVVGWLYTMNRAPLLYAFFSPLGGLVVSSIFWNAAAILQNQVPIYWGGRKYILEPKTNANFINE